MKHLVEKIIELMPEFKTSINYLSDRPADVPRLWVDASLIRKTLSIHNEKTFDEGIEEAISYYKELNKKADLSKSIKTINWVKE